MPTNRSGREDSKFTFTYNILHQHKNISLTKIPCAIPSKVLWSQAICFFILEPFISKALWMVKNTFLCGHFWSASHWLSLYWYELEKTFHLTYKSYAFGKLINSKIQAVVSLPWDGIQAGWVLILIPSAKDMRIQIHPNNGEEVLLINARPLPSCRCYRKLLCVLREI